MTISYTRAWKTLNELEAVSSKICSAREILDSAIVSLETGNRQKTETLMYAVDEYLQYYLEEFDRKFKDAWNETIVKLKQEEVDDYMRPWGHSDMEALSQYTDNQMDAMCDNAELDEKHSNHYYDYTRNDYTRPNPFDKVVKWRLPIDKIENGEYFITLPDDLLEAANLSPGDDVEWVEQEVGTFILRKIKKTLNHDEAIAAGWTMTDDGFWINE
jgi:antitoxin component of MazEF toxin-antitoxin module